MKKRIYLVIIIFSVFFQYVFSENLMLKETYDIDSITDLSIDLSFEELEIDSTSNDEFVVEISSNNDKRVPKVENKNGTLSITTIKKLSLFGTNCSIKLYIPRNVILNNVSINTASGNIDVSNFDCDTINVMTASGVMNFDNINVQNDSNILSVSGGINIEDFETVNLRVVCTNGKISIEDLFSEYLDIKATSSNVLLNDVVFDYFDIKTISGDITLEVNSDISAKSSIETISGDIEIEFDKSPSFDLEMQTTSGRLIDEINTLSVNPRGLYKKSYNLGGAVLSIKTISGNVRIS